MSTIIIQGIHIMACDHSNFKIYTVIQVTDNHDSSVVFLKKCTIMAHVCIDFRYTYVTDNKNSNMYQYKNYT